MTLRQDPGTPGLWRADPALTSGVHAFIAGVSDYPHLDGGSGSPAAGTGGMGQLEVSAKTAAKVFAWLRDAESAAGAPLASVAVHLAPRPTEMADVQAATGGHYGAADAATLKQAIKKWGDRLMLGGRPGARNVALFFFSGHGIEHLAEPALLASDILDPDSSEGRKNAVAFGSMIRALKTFGIDLGLFFSDACRNAPDLVRLLDLEPESVLAPLSVPGRPPREGLVWLQATEMGQFAYQRAGDPATLFGQALLEGLEGLPPSWTPYDCAQVPWRLVFSRLEAHVHQGVSQRLAAISAGTVQPVDAGGDPYKPLALVAERTPAYGLAARYSLLDGGPRRPPPGGLPDPGEEPVVAEPRLDAELARAKDLLGGFKQVFTGVEGVQERNPSQEPKPMGAYSTRIDDPVEPLASTDLMHEVFGHEDVTFPFAHDLRLLDTKGEPIDLGRVFLVGGHRQETVGRLTSWIDVAFMTSRWDAVRGGSIWLQFGGGPWGPAAGVLLKAADPRMIVRLDLTYSQHGPGPWRLDSFRARLGPPDQLSEEERGPWQQLWRLQQAETLLGLQAARQVLTEQQWDWEGLGEFCSIAAPLLVSYALRTDAHELIAEVIGRLGPAPDADLMMLMARWRDLAPDDHRKGFGLLLRRTLPPAAALSAPTLSYAFRAAVAPAETEPALGSEAEDPVRSISRSVVDWARPSGTFVTYYASDGVLPVAERLLRPQARAMEEATT